jgi:hypothetical protein
MGVAIQTLSPGAVLIFARQALREVLPQRLAPVPGGTKTKRWRRDRIYSLESRYAAADGSVGSA